MAGLFGSKTKEPEVKPMPDEEDPNIKAARQRQYELARSQSGRAAQVLSDDYGRDRFGGGF